MEPEQYAGHDPEDPKCQRIVAHYMDSRQFERALQLISSREVTPSYVYGLADAEGIRALRADGLVVVRLQEISAPPRPPVPPIPRGRLNRLLLAIVSGLRVADGPAASLDAWVVSLAGPLMPQWEERLHSTGIVMRERLGGHDHLAWLTPKEHDLLLSELPFVIGTRRYSAAETVHPGQLVAHPFLWLARRHVKYVVQRQPGADYGELESALQRRGARRLTRSEADVRFEIVPSPRRLVSIARLPFVASLYEHARATASNDHVRALVGVDGPNGGLTGEGQVVAVADTGVDAEHDDIHDRLVLPAARDACGHGTHVAATIAGTGAKSGSQYRGVAPGARILAQVVLNARRQMIEDVSIAQVLQDAYDAGARIHNDSWGITNNASAYRYPCAEVDAFVAAHPEMLVVTAAGNCAIRKGRVSTGSLDAPATAKNVLTVGASRSDRPGDCTWREWDDRIEPPLGDETVGGDAQHMAAVSSRGPCDDGVRVKPDLVAPGTWICSALATGATPGRLGAPVGGHYSYDLGTSMAAAVVSGCAALVREYLAETGHHTPSAALVKAILMNGARPLVGADATDGGDPNFHQGFGAVSLGTTLPGLGDPALRLSFRDEDVANGLTGSECVFFELEADLDLPMCICLVWTDRGKGRTVQNPLDLLVTHEDSDETWQANPRRSVRDPHMVDYANNVQTLRFPSPRAGRYRIRVGAYQIEDEAQPFALVATGALHDTGLVDG
jgi:serine protease AprX